MKKMIKIEIYHDGEFYCARCIDDLDIFSQGKTLDEVVKNIKESITLYFEDEPLELAGFDRNHKITIPNHDPVAKGTLSDILSNVSLWCQIDKQHLAARLKEF